MDNLIYILASVVSILIIDRILLYRQINTMEHRMNILAVHTLKTLREENDLSDMQEE